MDKETKKFVKDVELFAAAIGVPPSLVTRRAVDDGGLIDRLKNGTGSCTFKQAARVRAYIAENSPATDEVA